MAGSLERFLYTEDSPDGIAPGRVKLIRLDESNTRGLGEVPATAAAVAAAGIANRVERAGGNERYILVKGKTADGELVSRKIVVPSPTNTLFLQGGQITLPVLTRPGNSVIENVLFGVSLAVGEVRSFIAFTDTGLDDGIS